MNLAVDYTVDTSTFLTDSYLIPKVITAGTPLILLISTSPHNIQEGSVCQFLCSGSGVYVCVCVGLRNEDLRGSSTPGQPGYCRGIQKEKCGGCGLCNMVDLYLCFPL